MTLKYKANSWQELSPEHLGGALTLSVVKDCFKYPFVANNVMPVNPGALVSKLTLNRCPFVLILANNIYIYIYR